MARTWDKLTHWGDAGRANRYRPAYPRAVTGGRDPNCRPWHRASWPVAKFCLRNFA
jgi:hypothetical protein